MSKRKREFKTVAPSPEQLKFLEDLWFVWGNYGKRHTMSNHKFIQAILDRREWDNKYYNPDRELESIVVSILEHPVHRTGPCKCEKCGKRTMNEIEVMGRFAAWCGCP
jgi:hypothetical protein